MLFRGVGGVDFAPARLSLGTSRNCRGWEESDWVLEESVAMVGPGRFQAQKYTLHWDDLQDLEKKKIRKSVWNHLSGCAREGVGGRRNLEKPL